MQDFTNFSPNQQSGSLARATVSSEALFFQRIYTWMFTGLLVTAGMAYMLSQSPAFINFMFGGSSVMLIVAFVAQIGLVMYLSARINALSPGAAKGLFLAYSALTGLTLSFIGLVYPPVIIFKAFITTAGVYGAMAVYGLVTKRSLQGLGSFLFMGLWGIIIASVVNIFMRSNMMDLMICVIGVFIFAGLTAYDHQKLRVIHATGLDGTAVQESRMVIIGALNLYLDFINLFLFLLRLFGRGND